MPQTLEGSLPGVPLTDGQKVVLEARDPTDGSAVAGVQVSEIQIYGLDLTGGPADLKGPFLYVPGPETDMVPSGA